MGRIKGVDKKEFSILVLLKACAKKKDIHEGSRLHGDILKRGLLAKSPYLASALVNMYAKCAALTKAQQVLEKFPFRNVILWNTLITGYAEQGQVHEALICFERMEDEGLSPDVITFICLLKACGKCKAISAGMQLHDIVVSRGFEFKDITLCNALVDMYAKCGLLDKAHQLLEELPIRDVVSWNALIAGYVQNKQDDMVLNCFEQMQSEGLSPDAVTFILILKSCSRTSAIDKGKCIHENIVRRNLLEKDVVLGTAVVDMYAKCKMFEKAWHVLDGLPVRDTVSWNALITGYSQQGKEREAFNCFERMQHEGLFPNTVTYISILKACGSTGAVDKGRHIHDQIVNRNFLGNDAVLGNALVDMYAKCGLLDKALEVLEDLPEKNVVSWSSLIAGYVQAGQMHEALYTFDRMQNEGLSPDAVTFICILKACGSIGAIDKGEQIHDEVVNRSLLKNNIILGTALVDMYARCGVLDKAKQLLDELCFRDVVSWSALVAGYALRGQGHEAVICFKEMENEGLYPDEVTFLSILSACNHSGLLDEAQIFFEIMTRKYFIAPNIEHLNCMVLLFGCSGNFDQVTSVIHAMPFFEYPAVWIALLGVCRKWGNIDLGKFAFDQVIQQDASAGAAYILMADIFAAAGMLDDAEKIQAIVRQKQIAWRKETVCCELMEEGMFISFP